MMYEIKITAINNDRTEEPYVAVITTSDIPVILGRLNVAWSVLAGELPPWEDDKCMESADEAASDLGQAILFGEPFYVSPLARTTVFGGYRKP